MIWKYKKINLKKIKIQLNKNLLLKHKINSFVGIVCVVEDKLWQQLRVCKKIKKSIKLRKLEKK